MFRIVSGIFESQDLFAINKVSDLAIININFKGHPLISMESSFDIGWRTE